MSSTRGNTSGKRTLLRKGQPSIPAHPSRPSRRLRLAAAGGALSPGHALDPMIAAAGNVASVHLGMPEPDSPRRALITSAISALLHLIALGVIVVISYLAKEAVEKVIPLEIRQPLLAPGSNEPAPIPKMISSTPVASQAVLAQAPVATVVPQVAPAPTLDNLAPTPIDVAQITAPTLAAKPPPSAANVSDYKPLDVTNVELEAPTVDLSGPTATAVRTPVNLDAPQVFGEVPSPGEAYAGRAEIAASRVHTPDAAPTGAGVETGVAPEFIVGGVDGGNPDAVGTVPCMQSAYVQRYLDVIEQRTTARWTVPMGAAPEEVVTLRFHLDYAGGATNIEVVSTSSDAFGRSALTALTAAAPFPPLDDNIRCLAERDKPVTVKFTNPTS